MIPDFEITDLVWFPDDAFLPGPWLPIASAPRNGMVITVMDPDNMSADMWWNVTGTNPVFQRGMGIWEAVHGQFTWSEEGGNGPSYWRPCGAELADFLRRLDWLPASYARVAAGSDIGY